MNYFKLALLVVFSLFFSELVQAKDLAHVVVDEDDIIGDLQRVKLPFKCEQHIVEWEVQAFENESQELTDGLGSTQFYCHTNLFYIVHHQL